MRSWRKHPSFISRNRRLESIESGTSSGRVSPSLMESIREICVATEPPSPESETEKVSPPHERVSLAGGDGDRLSLAGGEGDRLSLAGGEGDRLSLAGGEGDRLSLAGGEGDRLSLADGEEDRLQSAGGIRDRLSLAGGDCDGSSLASGCDQLLSPAARGLSTGDRNQNGDSTFSLQSSSLMSSPSSSRSSSSRSNNSNSSSNNSNSNNSNSSSAVNSTGGRKRRLSPPHHLPSSANNSILDPSPLLSPLRYPHHEQQQGVLVSPPSKPNHFAFKLFKKCPVPPSPGGDNGKCPISPPGDSGKCPIPPPGGNGKCRIPPPGLNCSSVTDDDDGIVSSPPLVPVFPSLLLSATTKPRRKSSQLGGSEVVASLKRSRSTMRQDLSLLPLINNSTSSNSNSSVAKENNCDSSSSSSSSMLQQQRSDVAEAGAMLPPLSLAVEFSGGDDDEVPSRVLRDRNAEKSTAPPSLDAWHRYLFRVSVGGTRDIFGAGIRIRGSIPLTHGSTPFFSDFNF
jgi:hypothetical protein